MQWVDLGEAKRTQGHRKTPNSGAERCAPVDGVRKGEWKYEWRNCATGGPGAGRPHPTCSIAEHARFARGPDVERRNGDMRRRTYPPRRRGTPAVAHAKSATSASGRASSARCSWPGRCSSPPRSRARTALRRGPRRTRSLRLWSGSGTPRWRLASRHPSRRSRREA